MRQLLVLLLLAAPVTVRAAEQGDPVEIAKTRFALGDLLYRSERYREAVVEFEAARLLAPRPDLDYNIARCYERLRDWDGALREYTRYIESTPTPLDADKILAHIEEIKELRAREARQPGHASSPAARRTRGPYIASLVLGAVGVLGVGAGAGFGIAAQGTADELTQLDRNRQRFDPSLDRDLSTERALEGAFLGIGAAALVGSAVAFTIGRLHERRAHLEAGPSGLRVEF